MAKSIRGSRPIQDIIVADGDHFTEVQKVLEQALGKPDPGLNSSASDVNARFLTYTPAQVGVLLNLTGDWEKTIVSVIGKQKP